MKRTWMLLFAVLLVCNTTRCQTGDDKTDGPGLPVKPTIFVYGNGLEKEFIRYIADLTQKKRPIICLIPTAAADNPRVIDYWYDMCSDMPIRPGVLKTFIASSPEQDSFEDIILDADAIIVGGGNTLNMIAIWKAQGIDTLLAKAYENGIVLAGGSAGSLCWFTGGYTDSRPRELSLMEGLGFLPYSHSPHYHGNHGRRALYKQAIQDGTLGAGYACDDGAGLLFIDGKMVRSVSLHPDHHSYYVYVDDTGILVEERLDSDILKK
jgi:peptidase E